MVFRYILIVIGLFGRLMISVLLCVLVVWWERIVVGVCLRLVWCIRLLNFNIFLIRMVCIVLGVLLCGDGLVLLVVRMRLMWF